MILLSIMTCNGREQALDKTLISLNKSDWGDEVLVTHDSKATKAEHPSIRQIETSRYILGEFLKTTHEYLLFCEDDIEFNHHLAYNLANWHPLKEGLVDYATLYNLGFETVLSNKADHWEMFEHDTIYGSQAILLSRMAVETILECWDNKLDTEETGHQDLRFVNAAQTYGIPFFGFVPSLVQHQQVESTWNGPSHSSEDFDKDFKL